MMMADMVMITMTMDKLMIIITRVVVVEVVTSDGDNDDG